MLTDQRQRTMPSLHTYFSHIRVGFIILSHSNNPQLSRLLDRLNTLYNQPPIAIHHDFSQSPLSISEGILTKNTHVLRPSYKTRWGHISVIDAFLSSLEVLYRNYAPDWFYLLSASCYPVASPNAVLKELENTNYDAFVGFHQIYPKFSVPLASEIRNIEGSLLSPALPTRASGIKSWLKGCYHRYIYMPGGNLFGPEFRCYVGDHWFSGNAKVANILLDSRREHNELFYYYTNVLVPEESYYQTVLCNRTDLSICPNNKRFAIWHTPEPDPDHPLELTTADLTPLLISGCHFARKFSHTRSNALLDVLDSRIAGVE